MAGAPSSVFGVRQLPGISFIAVEGFKSIVSKQEIELGMLTVLAGANSSGKSSMLQPLLLLKQTLEATYNPGALLLSGPNVRFTNVEQFLAASNPSSRAETFSVTIGEGDSRIRIEFARDEAQKGLRVASMRVTDPGKDIELVPGRLPIDVPEIKTLIPFGLESDSFKDMEWFVRPSRCFMDVELQRVNSKDEHGFSFYKISPADAFEPQIRRLIHLPGLRGNPERAYPLTAVSSSFPGTFEQYAASVIAQWGDSEDHALLAQLGRDLAHLGLTWKASARRISDAQVELRVGRLVKAQQGGAHDLVNIADVGFGVSQVLPVIVALLVAQPGQLVYLEQPEIHLHPDAQVKMAMLLARAAKRGVRVVVETHSALLLLGVQSLVAQNKLNPDHVKLHWFTRTKGRTVISSASLDRAGTFGDWPEDFAHTTLAAEQAYLDAVSETHP